MSVSYTHLDVYKRQADGCTGYSGDHGRAGQADDDFAVEILRGCYCTFLYAGEMCIRDRRRHLKKKKDNMRKESLSNDECASAVDLTLVPEVKDNSEESFLIHCPACGLEVSRYAPTCPRCGHSIYLIRPLQQLSLIHISARSAQERFPTVFDWLKTHDVNAAVILVIMVVVAVFNMAKMCIRDSRIRERRGFARATPGIFQY